MSKHLSEQKSKLALKRKKALLAMAINYILPLLGIVFMLAGFVVLNALGAYEGVQDSSVYIPAYFILICGGLIMGLFAMFVRRERENSKKVLLSYKSLQKKHRLLNDQLDNQKGLNETLQSSEEKNLDIIHSIKDVIFEANEEGRIIFLNESWEVMTGFDIEQSVGQSLFSVLHHDDQEDFKQEFDRLIKGRSERYRAFTQLRRFDGTFGAVEVSISVIAKDHKDGLRLAGTITDIEERRKAERALGEAEKKYRNIVQNAAGGIYQLTPEGLYLSANPALARILGFDKPEQLLREVKNANESVYTDTEERLKFVKKLELEKEALQREVQMTRRDGEVIWVSESARAVRDEKGLMLFIEGSIEDITERKESEITIRNAKIQSDLANRAKSEFLSNMSHELRTPLNSIIGFSEMIKNEVFGPVGQKAYWEYSKDIYESGQGLLRVINEILDISKIEAGERQLNEGVIVVQETVRDCLGLLEHKLENNDLTVTVSLDNAPNIVGEELSVKQILMNLLSNAIKFTPENGRVTISSHVDQEGRFHLSVSDTGVGLDDDGIAKALSPFGQVNSELNRSGSGTGLGLTLVDSLTKLHGGEFELFSQKGIGTTATVIFPKNRVVEKSEEAQQESFADNEFSETEDS